MTDRIKASRAHSKAVGRWIRAKATKECGALGAARYEQATDEMRHTWRIREQAYGRG